RDPTLSVKGLRHRCQHVHSKRIRRADTGDAGASCRGLTVRADHGVSAEVLCQCLLHLLLPAPLILGTRCTASALLDSRATGLLSGMLKLDLGLRVSTFQLTVWP